MKSQTWNRGRDGSKPSKNISSGFSESSCSGEKRSMGDSKGVARDEADCRIDGWIELYISWFRE